MRVAIFTREYPPDVYGGAGVHVEYLTRELRAFEDVTVHAWGTGDVPHTAWDALAGDAPHLAALRTLSIDLTMTARADTADIVHSHTWYANLAGHLSKLTYDIPHVATVHSLEPLRPWKAEQLGGGYALSSWAEKTALEAADAIIAVSQGSRADMLERAYPDIDPGKVTVIYNGIDTEQYAPDPDTDVLAKYGVDPDRPSVVFVGRITRQKGVELLLEAARSFVPEAQLVLCAGSADTPELGAEVERRVADLKSTRSGVIWLEQMLPKHEVIQLLSHATVFACPSIYEPLGIVNLEAMACEAAVVASHVGGIPEVVVDGETGYLVPLGGTFAAEFAERVNALIADPDTARAMGRAGRERAVNDFAWGAIAEQTSALYRSLV
jgi:starch synthase